MTAEVLDRSRGALLFEQRRREHRFQLFGDLALFELIFATGTFMIIAESGDRLMNGVLGALAVVFSLLISLQIRWRPFRLYTGGLEPPNPRAGFLSYSGMRHAQFHQVTGRKPNFLIVTRSDGKSWFVGGPHTKKQMINTRDFERVSSLITRGVSERGFRSGVSWRPDAWAEIESIPFCGRVIVLVEALARERGVDSVDEDFLRWAIAQRPVAGALKLSRLLGGTRADQSANRSP